MHFLEHDILVHFERIWSPPDVRPVAALVHGPFAIVLAESERLLVVDPPPWLDPASVAPCFVVHVATGYRLGLPRRGATRYPRSVAEQLIKNLVALPIDWTHTDHLAYMQLYKPGSEVFEIMRRAQLRTRSHPKEAILLTPDTQ